MRLFAMQITEERAVSASKVDKAKGKCLILVLTTQLCTVLQPHASPPARC